LLIYVVDDEPDILELVSLHLKKANFRVREFRNATGLLAAIRSKTPDLVILDLMLPDEDGLEVCKAIRQTRELASIPVIMLTALGDEADRVLGLELGADDYITKPFSPRELVARVKAVLRRKAYDAAGPRLAFGDLLVLDSDTHEVTVEGKVIDLTSTEFKILKLLASGKERVFAREEILDHLWGPEKAVLDRTVDVHIRHLREKLGKAAALIKNVRGVGYKLKT